jgi:hypothetical protein
MNLTAGPMEGLQIGVVNWANDLDGIQIGVLNATARGLIHTGSWIDETGMAYFTITTGAGWGDTSGSGAERSWKSTSAPRP